MHLTRQHLRTKPAGRPLELRDDDPRGLILRVQPSGVRTWYVELGRGKRIRIGAAEVITLDGARDRAKRILLDPAKATAKKAGTLGEFLKDHYAPWCTSHLKGHVKVLRHIKAAFADLMGEPLDAITVATVEKTRTRWLQEGAAPKTANNRIGELAAILSKAHEWGVIERHPLADLKPLRVDNAIVRFLSPDESARLDKTLQDQHGEPGNLLRCAVIVSRNTGLRQGELRALRWADIDFTRKVLTVRAAAAKGGRTRHVPLNAAALAALQERQATATEGDELAFNIPHPTLWTAWSRLAKAAGIVNCRWHDLRHDFASQLVMQGVDLNTVRELMGHTALTMTLRYAHLAPEHKAAAVEKLIFK